MVKILKEDAEKRLGDVSMECAFWCNDGSVLMSLRELERAFTNMADETFAYHQNTEKCDFSNWVRDVFVDEKLARDIAKSTDKNKAAKCVAERLEFLGRKL